MKFFENSSEVVNDQENTFEVSVIVHPQNDKDKTVLSVQDEIDHITCIDESDYITSAQSVFMSPINQGSFDLYSESDNSLKENFLLNESNNNLLSEIEVLESDIPVTPLPPKSAQK